MTEAQRQSHIAAAKVLKSEDIPEILRKAEAGDPEAQWMLGYGYAEGIAVEKDYAKARQWFQTANDSQPIGSRNTRGRPANSRCRKGAGTRTKAILTALALRGQISPH